MIFSGSRKLRPPLVEAFFEVRSKNSLKKLKEENRALAQKTGKTGKTWWTEDSKIRPVEVKEALFAVSRRIYIYIPYIV